MADREAWWAVRHYPVALHRFSAWTYLVGRVGGDVVRPRHNDFQNGASITAEQMNLVNNKKRHLARGKKDQGECPRGERGRVTD